MTTNPLLHSFSRSYSHHRKNCANKYESMKSCVFKYMASLFICMLISAANAWGATQTWTFPNATDTLESKTPINMTWGDGSAGTHVQVSGNSDATRYLRLYSHRTDGDGCWVTFTTVGDYEINAVQVIFTGNRTVARGRIGTGDWEDVFSAGTSQTIDITGLTTTSYSIKNGQTSGDAKTVTIASITITYSTTGCTSITPSLSYSSDSIVIGGKTSEPTIVGNTGEGTVTYSSSNPSIAEIDDTGVVTGVTTGEVTITASIAESGDYCDGEASATINVYRPVNYYIGEDPYAVGGKDDQELLSVLPSQPSTCNVFDYPYFYGWKDGSIDGITTTAPTVLSTDLVSTSNGKTYYAVFRDWFCWNGGTSSSLTSLSGVTASGLGSDYAASHAPYRVKLDGTGDYIIVSVPSQPSQVTAKVKLIGGAITAEKNTKITVYQSTAVDGDYSKVEDLSIVGAQNGVVTLETSASFAASTRAIKLYFDKGDDGSNVGLGYILVDGVANANYVTSCGTMYDITLDKNGGDADGSAKVLENTKSLMYITAPTKTGHEVDGYYTTSALTTKIATSIGALQASVTEGGNNWTTASSEWTRGEDETFFTKWVPCKYDVTLIKNGSSASNQVVRATYGSAMPDTIKAVGNTSISVPTRTGYTFNGYWDTKESEGGKQYYSYSGEPAVLASAATWDKASNTDLYERWTANVYTVTLDNKNPTTQGVTSVTATYGQLMPELDGDLPTKTGYRFDGYWTTASAGTQYYDAEGTPKVNMNLTSENATLHAHWIPLLTFSVNGVIDDALTCDDNTAMPSSADVPTACGDCWEFVGWSTDSNKSDEPEYAGGDTHQFSSPTTLYAVYEKTADDTYATRPDCQTYTITWKVSGQVYTTGDPTLETNTCAGIETMPTDPEDDAISCSDTFMGWSETELTGTGHDVPTDLFTTADGAPIIDGNKTFHAVFATETDGVTPVAVPFSFTITTSDFNGKSYADNNNEKTSTATATDESGYTTTVKWTSNQVMLQSEKIQWKKSEGYIYNSTDLGTVTSVVVTSSEGTFTTYYGDEEQPSSGSAGLGKGYFKTSVGDATGKASSVEVSFTKNITPKVHINYQTFCTYTFNASTDNNWSTADNWSSRSVPTINDRATITKPVTVDIATAKAKDIVLDRSGGNTGSLTISANKALEVAEKVRVWHGSAYGTTTASDLQIESSASGNGTLIFENNENQATVQMYCRANSTASPNPTWQYIGTPFIGSIPLYNYYNGYMYKWGNGWESVDGDDEMEPFVGYSVSYPGEGHIFTMEGELVSTLQTRVITVESHKNKVVANSWTAPIQIKQLREADFVNLNRSVYFYNTGYTPAGTADVTANPTGEDRYAAGTYISLPIHAAKYTSSDSVISSMQGFYVKNATESEGTLTLNYAQHVVPAGSTSIVNGAMHAPKRVQEDEEPVVAKILASGTNYDALLVLLERGDFSFGYDDGWDGDLMGNNTAAPRIYTRTETGTRDVVSAVPDFEGMTIYFRAGTDDNKYTFHFTYDENEEPLYLVDTDTNEYKRVLTGNSYTFYTSDNLAYGRFYLTYRAPSVTTDIDTNGANESTMKAIKYIENDNLYILRGGVIYDATGRRANNSTNH